MAALPQQGYGTESWDRGLSETRSASQLSPGDMIVMDHLRTHKAVGIQQAMARRGARLLSLPPDSPDLSPIEPGWSQVEMTLCTAKPHTRVALDGHHGGIGDRHVFG